MGLFGKRSFEEFGVILQAANAAFGKDGPSGWTQLKMSDLNINQTGDTFTSPNGRGKAIVLEKDGELIVAFRGTDKKSDIKDYDGIAVSKSYSKQFDKLLDKVAAYQEENDLHTTFTGISLGGAVTNIIAERAANRWGKDFIDSSFVGIASPYLAGNRNRDLFNIGFENDLIYGLIPGSSTKAAKELSTDNLYIYVKQRFMTDNLDDNIYAHHVGNFNQAIASLQGLTEKGGAQLVDVLKPDSYVIFDHFKGTVKAEELRHPRDSVLTIIGQGRDDWIVGTNGGARGSMERIYGMNGDDTIRGKHGRDEIYGGNGNDNIDGGHARDWMYGGAGNDRLVFETHGDFGEGGTGNDRFIIKTVTRPGPEPASVIIADFTPGEDKFVFKLFDGNSTKKGMQDLRFSEFAVYDDSDGLSNLEKGYVNDKRPGSVTIYEDQNGDTFLIINTDHDRQREFQIKFEGSLGDFSRDLLL
ncbi:calcium-binding protein [Rhizobium sp.]